MSGDRAHYRTDRPRSGHARHPLAAVRGPRSIAVQLRAARDSGWMINAPTHVVFPREQRVSPTARKRRVAATRRLWHDGHRHRRSNPGRPSDIKTTLELRKLRSRLGESNPRPTHYERRDHRIHHALAVHRCTSQRSPCTTTPSVGRHFRPRTRPRRRSTSCFVKRCRWLTSEQGRDLRTGDLEH
jgi:hypothetical protein